MVSGVNVIRAIGVPDDSRDRVGLDDEIFGEPVRFGGGGVGGCDIGVPDDDQIRHGLPFC